MFRVLKNRSTKMIAIIGASIVLCACGKNDTVIENNELPSIESVKVEDKIEEIKEVKMENDEEMTESKVYFNWCSGFYKEDIDLEMICPIEGAKIYYTTDGTIPTVKSNEYNGPIKLSDRSNDNNVYSTHTDLCIDSQYVPKDKVKKANIIRAIAVFEDGSLSTVSNGTFFVGLDKQKLYGDAPVVSLITEPDNLFDYENGIYVLGKAYDEWLASDPKNAEEPGYRVVGNFSNKGKDWERPVYFEYIESNGRSGYSSDMGLRMKGASTRTYLQKSMRLIAREEYGNKSIKYNLIPGNMRSDNSGEVEKYKSFVLRNGGNDTDFGKLRDPFWQTIISDRNVETQQFQPCVLFLDGEYWGLYTLVEDYTDSYFENNYGIDKKDVVIVKTGKVEEGEEQDIHLYNEMFDFIIDNDMSDSLNYDKACQMLDVPGFAEYVAFNLYIYNHDSIFENNNWSMWRTREKNNSSLWSDGKWRMMVYDTEYSSGVYTGGKEFDQNNLIDILSVSDEVHEQKLEERCPSEIFYSLLDNDEFKCSFINTLCDIRNYDCEKQYAWGVLGEISPVYQKLAGDSIRRNGPDWVVEFQNPDDYYSQKIKELQSFIGGRYGAFPNQIRKAIKTDNPVEVNINIPSNEIGSIKLNYTNIDTKKLSSDKFTGMYFEEYPITLTANSNNGKKFVRWEVEKGEVLENSNNSIKVKVSNGCIITPVFE